MQNIYEGCSIEQIANCCNIYKITYYVMSFRYKLFDTTTTIIIIIIIISFTYMYYSMQTYNINT